MPNECFAVSVIETESGKWYCSALRELVLPSNSRRNFFAFEELLFSSPQYDSEAEAWLGAAHLAMSPKGDIPRSDRPRRRP